MADDRKWNVLITGCSSGIGRALAEEFRRHGHRPFATARREDSVRALRDAGFDALRLDVDDADSITAAVAGAVERAGHLDMLVNNAGFSVFGPLAELRLDQVRHLFETNLFGPLALVQAVFRHMAERRSGRIVNVGSLVGVIPTPFAGAYCSTKAALHMLSEVLRMEAEPLGLEVVVVQPGAVRSSVSEKSVTDNQRFAADSSLYRRVAAQIERRANASQANPMETAEFARRMVRAVTAPRAPRTVRIGNGVAFLPFLRGIPGGLRDRLLSRQFGLDRLRE